MSLQSLGKGTAKNLFGDLRFDYSPKERSELLKITPKFDLFTLMWQPF